MRLGIDVGGTNTDAVLMDGDRVLAWHKVATGEDITGSIVAAAGAVLRQGNADGAEVFAVMLGTTQFTNAVIERRRLNRVAVIRLAAPATTAVPPMSDWPSDLLEVVGQDCYLLHGGLEFDGREISALDENEIRAAARDIRAKGIGAIALTSVFSPLDGYMETRAAAILQNELPEATITLSHRIGRIGLLERENAAILNGALTSLADRVLGAFDRAILDLGLKAPLFISQNDGTLMTAAHAARYPVLTFASGPTNSIRGAAILSGLDDALVVDIGGTTTDIGLLLGGFPREAAMTVEVGGVRTNFRMPDLLAVGLGGGSLVRDSGDSIGPDSVGFELERRALVMGGDSLTMSDIAVASGLMEFGDRAKVEHIDFADIALETAGEIVEVALDQVRPNAASLPVILVGGGAPLLSGDSIGGGEIMRPEYGQVANAIGASIAMVSGECDRIFSLDEMTREDAVASAKARAASQAQEAGAEPESIRIVEMDEVPLSYRPGNTTRLRVKAVGDLAGASVKIDAGAG
ncbi:MAG: hydantoinase/oxoprolinase family protein [Rhodospirillaceae bacterium]|nr:hydantoinase/oxoprolinase family protein [Rhodospirillaceae bacterium]MBT5897477.1 hydantoinase/oxoprolinase family protein [Rhodospirillaceae bacterium]MBT6426267.1 hydantoinase/oxoprolinase family protein [Rhodospirillaceae bacterium]MBT7755862.1 hydantoinase/oxoprolinase family protein [Rhodospirillaceae bacterium]